MNWIELYCALGVIGSIIGIIAMIAMIVIIIFKNKQGGNK